jgi:ribonuclease HII
MEINYKINMIIIIIEDVLKSFLYHILIEAVCVEAGRGCLAGPVVAAAVILPKIYKHPVLNDSKKLTAKQRTMLRDEIISAAIDWKVAFIDNNEIDKLNILRASIKAMHDAIAGLRKEPEFLLIDGNRFYPYKNVKYQTIVKGDGLYFPIAAASVLAKTFRDDYMEKIHDEFPDYDWIRNKGYPTKSHRRAIMEYGITPYHRKSFHLFDTQLKFDFPSPVR